MLTTLRLHRAQIVVTGVFLVLLIVGAAVHGSVTAGFVADHSSGPCQPSGCAALATEVGRRYQPIGLLVSYLALLPVAVGAWWGAPLIGREFETGTTRFVWTQSVSRRSWILTSIITLALLVAGSATVVGVVVSQWLSVFGAFDLPGVTDNDNSFGQVRGSGPVGWWLFAFTLGVAAGAVLRRTVPAMAVTAAVVVAATIARNLSLNALAAERSASEIQQVQHIETMALIVVSVLMAAVAMRVVDRARA